MEEDCIERCVCWRDKRSWKEVNMSRTIVWSMELRSLGLANATILGTLSSVKYEHLFFVIYSDLTRTYGLMKQHTDSARSITT